MTFDQAVRELVEAATEVKYKSQRLKNALDAMGNVGKRDSFSDKPDRAAAVPLTVADLIDILAKLPQGAKVLVEGDYAFHLCEGAHQVNADQVLVEIG